MTTVRLHFSLICISNLAFTSVIPIPGTRNAERLAENSRGAELKLSPTDVKEIRDLLESADVGGGRYPDGVPLPTGECIPLSEWKGE